MFSLGQQNKANAAFIFHPDPRWGRHRSQAEAQVLSAIQLGMFCSVVVYLIQFTVGGFLVNKTAIWGIKKIQKTKVFPSFATSSLKNPSKNVTAKKVKKVVSGTPEIQEHLFFLQACYSMQVLSAPLISILPAEDK